MPRKSKGKKKLREIKETGLAVNRLTNELKGKDLTNLWEEDPALAKELAKLDYFNFIESPVIIRRYGIKASTLYNWVYDYTSGGKILKGWKSQRDEIFSPFIEALIEGKKKDIEEVVSLSLNSLKRALTALALREDPISATEMQKLMMIVAEAEKLVRLEAGKPTDIIEHFDSTPAGIKKYLEDLQKADPYVEYEIEDIEVPEGEVN